MKDSQLKAYNSYIRTHVCPIFIQAWIWLMWRMTILYVSTTPSNKNVIVNKHCLWHVTAQKICSIITPAKMHCFYFITSISVTPAKILSAKKVRLMSGQSAEHSCEINTETYYVLLREHFSWFATILTAWWSRYCIFNVCHQPQIAWGQKMCTHNTKYHTTVTDTFNKPFHSSFWPVTAATTEQRSHTFPLLYCHCSSFCWVTLITAQ